MNDLQKFSESYKAKKVNEAAEVTNSNPDVKIPVKLSGAVVKELTDRLADEYAAHYYYTNASNWCAGVGYMKAAKFFEGEAAAELEHAKGIQKYLVGWNVFPTINPVNTSAKFDSILDCINGAYEIEYDLFEKYNASSKIAFDAHLATFDFFQEYRKLQTESVAEFSDLLNALQLIDVTNRLDVLHFEDYYFG
jgi:ferritin